MSTLTSRPVEPTIRPSRNFLFKAEQQVVDRYRAMVIRELVEYLGEDDKQAIRLTPKDDVVMLHHSLGTAIRNEYELWMPEHEVTEIYHRCEADRPLKYEAPNLPEFLKLGGQMISIQSTTPHVDDHPCHPDNFSMSCVNQLWENLQ